MARTHHATRTFRLSCGCLRDYPGMATSRSHKVLCTACRAPAETLYAYPDHACGTRGVVTVAGRPARACCTNGKTCAGDHYDRFLKTGFTAPGSLRRQQDGETRRA